MPNQPDDQRNKQGGQQSGKPGGGQQQGDRQPQSTPGQGKNDTNTPDRQSDMEDDDAQP
jgi:hypothetical protein